jgi:alkanesulfonate monooxygenase SsuD/methylene tetrahydromethanopterin reductase-like flavin-dependent oxidoreductase (luciferase family)
VTCERAPRFADEIGVRRLPLVVVAGNGRAAVRRAARYGDGWATIGMRPEEIATTLEEIGRLATEHVSRAPTGTDWQRDYEFAAQLRIAYV